MLFYILTDKNGQIAFSPVPVLDRLIKGSSRYMVPGLPLEALLHYLEKHKGSECFQEKQINSKITAGLKKDHSLLPDKPQWNWIDNSSPLYNNCMKIYNNDDLLESLLKRLTGRQLTEGEFHLFGKFIGLKDTEVMILLHKAVLLGIADWVPCLYRIGNAWRCERCGNDQLEVWPSLYGNSATCQGCKSIGPLTSFQVIFRMKSYPEEDYMLKTCPPESDKMASLENDWQFTLAQSKAAEELCNLSGRKGIREILVWAACGAGKTEITFPVIDMFLKEGKSVLFAAPRQDVIRDIHLRLQRYFKETKVIVLSGAVQPDWENSLLTVATTHQVLRFYRFFDLIIFDEMDAFPFANNRALEFGMEKASKINAKIIYLTATPSDAILKKTKSNKCSVIRLPARFHGSPLPVPEILKIRLPDNFIGQDIMRNKSLHILFGMFDQLLLNGPLLVFVPTIKMVSEWTGLIRKIFKDRETEGSWSSDQDRSIKVDNFTSGRYDIFVCTSILERGVTVSGVQTVILYADHELYGARALVQMAGRTGRTEACPGGRVLFVAGRADREIRRAVDEIIEQNTLAVKGGYIH